MNRFPASGWLDGTVEDLADLIRLVSLPQQAVDEATTTLQEGIGGAAKAPRRGERQPAGDHGVYSTAAGDD